MNQDFVIGHRDDVPWWKAPLPSRTHDCQPQTTGWINQEWVERCACGATRFDLSGPWVNRNERQRQTANERQRQTATWQSGVRSMFPIPTRPMTWAVTAGVMTGTWFVSWVVR